MSEHTWRELERADMDAEAAHAAETERRAELIPCPFCGSGWLYETRRNGYCDETPTMFCNSCKAVVTWEQVEEEGVNDETKTFVREHWNTRSAFEMDEWFYLPKPKQQLFSYTSGFSFDDLSLKSTGTVDVYAITSAVQKWQEEALNKRIVERICEVFKPERTCVMYRYKNALGFIDEWQCSECGADVSGIADDTPPNYCPNCGAKVVEE